MRLRPLGRLLALSTHLHLYKLYKVFHVCFPLHVRAGCFYVCFYFVARITREGKVP